MGFVKDTFFGGAEKKAAKVTQKGLEKGQEFIRKGTETARQDLLRLFPQAQLSAQQGFQGALDVFNQALPQQAQSFQSGNVAAQQALLSGLPQFQNAILGGRIDLSGLQPFKQQLPNFSFANQRLPDIQQLGQANINLGGNSLQNTLERKFGSEGGIPANILGGIANNTPVQAGIGPSFFNNRINRV